MAIRGILFDKDGTLIDFPASWLPVLKDLSLKFAKGDAARAAELLEIAGFDAYDGSIKAGSIWAAGHTLDLVRAWLPSAEAYEHSEMARWVDGYCADVAPDTAMPLCNLAELFRELRESGFALGIATNDSLRSARATMERLGLSEFLAVVLGYDSVENPKPGADMVHEFCGRTGLLPFEVAIVGDNVHDVEMARAAGAGLAIGVLTGNARREHLEEHVDYLIASVGDLPELLESMAQGRGGAPCSMTP
jgi:phosphoglycolate phosphatase